MMELREFVKGTLVEIVGGVVDAQNEETVKKNGASVVPVGRGPVEDPIARYQEVSFDVAVTAREGTATKGGLGIFVGPIGVGTQGQSEAGESSVSRVRFTVPVQLPGQKVR